MKLSPKLKRFGAGSQVMKLSPELKAPSDISIETLLLIQPTVDLSAPAEKPPQLPAKVVLNGEMVEVAPSAEEVD